jgi:hypothetical protein
MSTNESKDLLPSSCGMKKKAAIFSQTLEMTYYLKCFPNLVDNNTSKHFFPSMKLNHFGKSGEQQVPCS